MDKNFADIKICSEPVRREQGKYLFDCKVYKRGIKTVSYSRGDRFVSWKNDRYFLDNEALDKVIELANTFDDRMNFIVHSSNFVSFDLDDCKVYYKEIDPRWYEVLVVYYLDCTIDYYSNVTYPYKLLHVEADGYREHPLYVSAREHGVLDLVDDMDLQCGYASQELIDKLGKRDGIARLPSLCEEQAKTCYVFADNFYTESLFASGYRVVHRPLCRMKGSTYKVWSIDPHNKVVIDAAEEENANNAISFEDFISFCKEEMR